MSRTFGVMALSARVLNYSWITFQLELGQVFMFCRGSRAARLKETNFCFFHSFCDWPKAERMATVDWVVCDC